MRLDELWYKKHLFVTLLAPLAWLFCALATLRRLAYENGLCKVHHVDVPVIVVGNITVGGTGKTPLVVWLVQFLKRAGYAPGVVARGYGGKARSWPQQVRPDGDPAVVGDEAILLARRCACPVAVAPDRVAAARALLEYEDCNIIVSDDGLQHYALGRDIEIAVVDGVRRYGNGHCLPAGPLREPVDRLNGVDIQVANGVAGRQEFAMKLVPQGICNLRDEHIVRDAAGFLGQPVHAVAGIGNPARFFEQLRKLGLEVIEHGFPDHHDFVAADIEFDDELPVLMTEKDAVKCRRFAQPNYWYVSAAAELDPRLTDRLVSLLKTL